MATPNFFSRSIVLASSATVYNVYDLIAALEPEFSKMVKTLVLQESHASSGSEIFVGDSSMTASSTGFALRFNNAVSAPDNHLQLVGTYCNIDLTAIYVRTQTNGTALNVVAVVE